VVTAPGFDERTGFLGAWETALPALPKNLTEADARQAYDYLSALWKHFPFETETDRAAMLAPLVTAIVRPWLVAENVAAPWFLITANRPGVGKSLAATLAGEVLGADALALTAADCPRGELAKRIDGYLLEARPLVVLDDVKHAFGSGTIDALATAGGSFDVRRLGSTGQIRCVNGTTWIVTGNNMALESDSGRRFVPIHLRSATPNPADLPDATAGARKHRERFLTAALTIVAAWLQNGSPPPPKGDKFPTYERWREIVAGALYFASGVDVCGRRGELESRDEKQQAMGTILAVWKDVFRTEGDGTVTGFLHWLRGEGGSQHDDVIAAHEALATLIPNFDPLRPSSAVLGTLLRTYADREIPCRGGRRLVVERAKYDHHREANRWAVREA
jgi:putative DNA primase/helicase